jgi:hypothetical protein
LVIVPDNVAIGKPSGVQDIEHAVEEHHPERLSSIPFDVLIIQVTKQYVEGVIAHFNSDPQLEGGG